jgi:hypothetical protein
LWPQVLQINEKKIGVKIRPKNVTPSIPKKTAVYCTTTDPYQAIRHPDPIEQKKPAEQGRQRRTWVSSSYSLTLNND